MRRDHGLSLSVRMGLNSGGVVVGDIGADRHSLGGLPALGPQLHTLLDTTCTPQV